MYLRHMLGDGAQRMAPRAAPTGKPSVEERGMPLQGRRVVLKGLVGRQDLNGQAGLAVDFDPAKG